MKKNILMACSFFSFLFFSFLLIIVGLTSMKKSDDNIEIMHEGCDLELKLEVVDNLPHFSLRLTVINNLGKTIALPSYCYIIFNTYYFIKFDFFGVNKHYRLKRVNGFMIYLRETFFVLVAIGCILVSCVNITIND